MTTSANVDDEVTAEHEPIKFKFMEGEDGLIAVEAANLTSLIAAWRDVDEEIDCGFWAQAAVAAQACTRYKRDKGAEKLAEAVEKSSNYVRQLACTYRTFSGSFTRVKDLSFTHHRLAATLPNPTEALLTAQAEGMSTRRFEEWIEAQNLKRASKATRKARKAAMSPFLEHLEHVRDVICSDFIANCPNRDFASRVYNKSWLQEIEWEIKGLNRNLNLDTVLAAIEEGAQDVEQIRAMTELSKSDIEGVVGQLVAQNEYEWVDRGGETEQARGTKSKILHKVGTPLGSGASVPKAVSRYVN